MDARLAGSERLSKTATQNWRIEPEGSDSVWSMYFEGGFRLTKYEMRECSKEDEFRAALRD